MAKNIPGNIPAPVGGVNAYSAVMSMPKLDAVMLDNWIPYPDRLQMRDGYASHATGFSNTPYRLWNYANGAGVESLWATTDTGIFNVTSAGAIGSAAIALTQGKTSAAVIATGANTYLMVVNGTDTLKQYDGASWTSVATYSGGAVSTAIFNRVCLYRQRLFFSQKNTLTIYYLPVNSISGTATSYDLGALFPRGGYIADIGTWTIDGGSGPEDQLAIATSKGEIAVFTGSDPGSITTWALQGVYFIGRPLGDRPFFKYGGDLLFLSENGVYPLSRAVQAASIERTRAVTEKVRALFNYAARNYSSNEGWQIIAQPDIPLLLVNVPSTPLRQQIVMHAQTGSWATLSGWNAYAFGRMGATLYFSTSNAIMRVTGVNDNGGNITATLVQAYSNLGYPRTKQIVMMKPYFQTGGNFDYDIGVASNFTGLQEASGISINSLGSLPLWGSAIWGSAVWAGSENFVQDWQSVADEFSLHKAPYLRVRSRVASVEYLGSDILFIPGGSFS